MMATYNEASNIESVLLEVIEAAGALHATGIDLAVLLVDDNSPDGTAKIARDIAELHDLRMRVVSGTKAGLGAAVLRGLQAATEPAGPFDDNRPADFIVTLDADRQHDARQIPNLVEAFLGRGSGILIGSRWTKGGASPGTTPLRMLISKGGNAAFRLITGTQAVQDATTSFRVIRPEIASNFGDTGLNIGGYAFFSSFIAVAQASGWPIHEEPIVFRPRGGGQSKLTGKDCVDFFTNLFRIRKTVRRLRAARGQAPVLQTGNHFPPVPVGASGRADFRASTFGAFAELESLSHARRSIEWIVDEIEPAIGNRIVDVGAGIGSLTAEIRRRRPGASLLAIDPALNMSRALAATGRSSSFEVRLERSDDIVQRIASGEIETFDTVIYSNVLQHIADDEAELRTASNLLHPDGNLILVVPAAPWAYGTMDHLSGHYRRYKERELVELLERTGFDIAAHRYLDPVGLLPYWFAYRVLGIVSLRQRHVAIYDRVLTPLSRLVQKIVPTPPSGRNLLVIARRPREQ
jgi:2-polyprenyl-3-methyl-5-hydroxy-6-metoxy-1,4-benzoquinol methylase